MTTDARGALRRSPLFSAFPAADVPELLAHHRVMEFEDGASLFAEGDAADTLFLILDGEVSLSSPAGVLRLGAGETVDEEAVLTGASHAGTARTVGRALLVALPSTRLMAYLESHFDVTIAMISAMAGSLRDKVREITELKMQSTAERLAGYLLTLAGESEGRAVVHLPVEKRLLADHLGMDPATLSRAFAKLRELGVTAGRTDKVEIADMAVLRDYGDCTAFTA